MLRPEVYLVAPKPTGPGLLGSGRLITTVRRTICSGRSQWSVWARGAWRNRVYRAADLGLLVTVKSAVGLCDELRMI